MVSDHHPLKSLESLATKVDRVERWFDLLSAYKYKLVYRPGRLNGNADLMSRLPLAATEEETSASFRLSGPSDVDIYFVGASGVQPRLRRRRVISLGGLECRTEGKGISLGGLECRTERRGISLNGLECQTEKIFKVGEKEVDQRRAPRTTDGEAKLLWQLMRRNRLRDQYHMRQPESPRVYTIRDDEPLSEPDESLVFSGQLEPGLISTCMSDDLGG